MNSTSFVATVFTPEVLERVGKMRAEGRTSRQIADAVGSTAGSVRQTLRRKRMKLPQDHKVEFRIGTATKEILCAEAERRGMKVRSLVRKILLTVAKDSLFAAILDDGE